MGKFNLFSATTIAGAVVLAATVAGAQSVKITALGSHAGEFCRSDRALMFEDPDGTVLLYDVGRTVAGADDPRLGKVDAVLLSGVHNDHIGDKRMAAPGAGTCAKPKADVSATPNTNTVEIAAANKSKIIVGGEIRGFLQPKITAAGGSAKQVDVLRHGGKRKVGGVTVAVVAAIHSNGVSSGLLAGDLGGHLKANGLNAAVGPENGYVLTFSNGLAVYLSGDTGHTSDMATIVNGYYKSNLAIVAIGDIYTMGPEEAAFAVNDLLKPKAVIPTHANEVATKGGKLQDGTKTAKFASLVKGIPVHLPLSGVPMEFDGNAKCVAGCS